jgi:hypothetical protein
MSSDEQRPPPLLPGSSSEEELLRSSSNEPQKSNSSGKPGASRQIGSERGSSADRPLVCLVRSLQLSFGVRRDLIQT